MLEILDTLPGRVQKGNLIIVSEHPLILHKSGHQVGPTRLCNQRKASNNRNDLVLYKIK